MQDVSSLNYIRKKQFKHLLWFYLNKIDETIKNTNENIYVNAVNFIESYNGLDEDFSKEVPTCIVETSFESTSNNET